MAPLPVATIADRASLIVVGSVIGTRRVEEEKGLLETRVSVRVAAVLRGRFDPRKTLEVRTRSGLVFFDRRLERGDAGVLFLRPIGNGEYEAAYPGSFALFERGTFVP